MASAGSRGVGGGFAARDWRRGAAIGAAALIAFTLFALIVLIARAGAARDAALERERHSYEVIILTRTLDGTLARSEAALGRFVISGNDPESKQLGRYYYAEWRRAGAQIDRIARETSDNPEQAKLVRALRSAYQKRGRELSAIALRTNYGQNMQALSAFYTARRGESLEEIRQALNQLTANEHAVLERRSADAGLHLTAFNRLNWLMAALGVVLVLVLIVLGWLTLQALAQRRAARRAAEIESLRAEELETAVAERTRELREANSALLNEAAERAHAENQLRQVQKMEAVGQLTGGIAHDFNNMLAVVVGGLELARRQLDRNSAQARRHIDNAMEGANRAAALTRRLLAFARAEPLLPESIDPAALIDGMRDLLDRTLGERIHVATVADEGLWRIWVDRHQLENAILNLAVNARDAMEGEGTLTIRATNIPAGQGDAGGTGGLGDHVRITVTDTGCGMSAAVLERVFEPFFTTKPIGKGTGLGLSQAFGFVRQSGGDVRIDSREGVGTTVAILLPRHTPATDADRGAAPPRAQPPDTPAAAEKAEKGVPILVVEDDLRVLTSTVDALKELGHGPIACEDPLEARAIMLANPGIRLIVTDVVMPGLSGPELVAALQPEFPGLGILFVTGYAADVTDADAFSGHEVLRKPFTIQALGTAVLTALDQAATRHDLAAE